MITAQEAAALSAKSWLEKRIEDAAKKGHWQVTFNSTNLQLIREAREEALAAGFKVSHILTLVERDGDDHIIHINWLGFKKD